MSMKPRANDHALPIPGCVNQPSPVSELSGVINEGSKLSSSPNAPIPGTVDQKMNPGPKLPKGGS